MWSVERLSVLTSRRKKRNHARKPSHSWGRRDGLREETTGMSAAESRIRADSNWTDERFYQRGKE